MICVDRNKEEYNVSGNFLELVTDISFAILQTAELYSETTHQPLESSINIIIDKARKGLCGLTELHRTKGEKENA